MTTRRWAAVTAVAALLIATAMWERVTRQKFGAIRIGMSQTELRHLLGPPDFQVVETGLVSGPGEYTTNSFISEEEKRRRGFQKYQRQQWASREVSIVVVSDLQGQTVCRYAGPGHKLDWIALLRGWLSRWL
jgi:hypothetical protein